jgi:hypothetical protein
LAKPICQPHFFFIAIQIRCANASIQLRQRALSERLVEKLDNVLDVLVYETDNEKTGLQIRRLLAPGGNLERLREDCAAIRNWSGKNHLPLLWKPFMSHRAVLFRIARTLNFEPATASRTLTRALDAVLDNENRRTDWIADEVDLSFASDRWRKLVKHDRPLVGENQTLSRITLAIFSAGNLPDWLMHQYKLFRNSRMDCYGLIELLFRHIGT